VNTDCSLAVAERLEAVRARIAAAARRAGRSPEEVTLVGITKGVPVERIRAAVDAGLVELGENRIQEWLPKIAAVGPAARWHFVGHLQTNKVRYLARGVKVLHSLDRPRLLSVLEDRWESWCEGLRQQGCERDPVCLLQLNVAGEDTKYGLSPEKLDVFLGKLVSSGCKVRVRGLMTIAPYTTDPESVRPVFARLRRLRDDARLRYPELGFDDLSMGMSGDFEVAVEEGATLVRIGTAIFGPRQ